MVDSIWHEREPNLKISQFSSFILWIYWKKYTMQTLCVLRSLKGLMWLKDAQSTTGNSLLGLAFRGTPPNNNSLSLFKFKFASFCFYVFLQ